MKIESLCCLACSGAFLLGTAQGALTVYVSPNDVESAEESGIIGVTFSQIFTETFNSRALGSINGYISPTIGVTYTTAGGGNVMSNDKYGGDAEGNYLGVASGMATTLLLPEASEYFGFYFTAGDVNNSIEIFSGGVSILNFSTSTLISMLPKTSGTTITAINGSQYNTLDYYGQPVTNQNSSEPYAYIHFVASGGTNFDKIVLRQGPTAIFENDNHSILAAAPTLPQSLVFVTAAPVPEPSQFSMLLSAVGVLLLVRKRGVL